MLAEKRCGPGGVGCVAQLGAERAAGPPLNVQHVHAAACQQGTAVRGVGVGRQGKLTALGPGADRDDQRLVHDAAHKRQRVQKFIRGQRVQTQLDQLGGGVGAGGFRQRAERCRIAGEQRHNDARPGGGQCETAKGYHSNHPLGAFSLF